jgi:hypothetical protein
MIVSASYRTDIPAFYGAWFVNRLRAGWCRVANPYGGPPSTVPLAGPGVDGFVFWTRNAGPFRPALAEVAARGLPFVVQFTITGYPRALETSVTDAARAAAQLRGLADMYGPRAAVWRYDPVLVTDLTPPAWHLETFSRLAAGLAGATDEVVVSFANIYRKTARNLTAAARRHGFAWRDPEPGEKRALLAALAPVAAEHGMALTLCTQPALLEPAPVPGTAPARCVDAVRLSDVAGRPVAAREKGNRPGCHCAESRDIGAYDTCPHGCVYCYAVRDRDRARRAHKAHDPGGPFLLPPRTAEPEGGTLL